MKDIVSKATECNWRRLNRDRSSRLTTRANKTASQRRVIATSYLNNRLANELLNSVMSIDAHVADIMFTLCCEALSSVGIIHKSHVMEFMGKCPWHKVSGVDTPKGIFADGADVLGFVYQSLVDEGARNLKGLYYTAPKIAAEIMQRFDFNHGQTVLDPCCGSGAFLLHCKVSDPRCLYGFDSDPVAVMIAGTNLLIKFRHIDFRPNVFCRDFLDCGLFGGVNDVEQFDYIVTNPPWGADRMNRYGCFFKEIKSRERASMVMVNSLLRLTRHGRACFILPVSLLSVTAHADVRRFILKNCRIERIDLLSKGFDGVFTGFFALTLSKGYQANCQNYIVKSDDKEDVCVVLTASEIADNNILLAPITDVAKSIIDKMNGLCSLSLASSRFALGIVTGDNKGKLLNELADGAEPIYTGKDVAPLCLLRPAKFIRFDRKQFQQCAPDECYRAPEKLVYRFIARYPIVAYDDTGGLTLNSANIIIPDVKGISTRSLCVLLNSSLYRFYYVSRFSDIKVLKSNLCKLPLPSLSPEQDYQLATLCKASVSIEEIDKVVYSLFDIFEAEMLHIKQKLENL